VPAARGRVLVQALFGWHGRWCLNEKGALAAAARLPGTPRTSPPRAAALLGSPGTTPADLEATVASAATLVAEVRAALSNPHRLSARRPAPGARRRAPGKINSAFHAVRPSGDQVCPGMGGHFA
jgi:hypothetical protein